MSSSLEARPIEVDAAAQTAQVASDTGRYIVTFREAGLIAYKGDVAGLARTAPDDRLFVAGASRKLDAKSAASVAYKAYLESTRADHIAAIEQKLGRAVSVHFAYDVTRSAISIPMSREEAQLVAQVDGVVAVTPVMTKHADTFRGPKFIGADKIWDGTAVPGGTGTRGQGVKVGVIDTGTNIGHPSFTDDASCGFSAANPKLFPRDCNSNNGTTCTGSSPNANDGQGHGVHTSSTAAGNTIDNTVTPAPLLPDGVTMSGVAPCASLYTYKVANATGGISDDAIGAAIQNAIVDQVDVVNFSIGPTCGGGNPWDDSLDFLAAEGADVFVAASAGNTRSTCQDPVGLVANNGPWMLTVAASTQDEVLAPELVVTGPGTPPASLDSITLIPGSATSVPDTTALAGMPLRTYPANLSGCNDTGGIPAHYFDGAIAVIRRGFQAPGTVACSFVEKITNATNAGAVMAVIANNQNQSTTMAADNTTIPAFLIPTLGVSDDLIAFVSANLGDPDVVFADGFDGTTSAGATGDYNRGAIFPTTGDVLAGFSFRGPTQAPYDNLTKPDITGPGVNIYAAFDAAEGSYGLDSGTSMSSPHLAGSAALVRAAHPTWTPMEVKSALQMTAKLAGVEQDGTTPWTVDDVGSGRVDLSKAALAGLTLDESVANFTAANPTGGSINQKALNLASVRDVNCGTSCSWTRTFKSQLSGSASWTLSATNPAGYTLSFSPSTFSIAAGATQAVTITATATAGSTTTLSFGEITLHEAGSQSPDLHVTAAIKGGDTTPVPGFCDGGVCTLQVDGMTSNYSALGCGAQAASCNPMLWMNQYSVPAGEYPITLNSVETIFSTTGNPAGFGYDVYIYTDTDGDPTNGATFVTSVTGNVVGAQPNQFHTVTIPGGVVLNGPGDVYIALVSRTTTWQYPASWDTGTFVGKSWLANALAPASGTPDLATLDMITNDQIAPGQLTPHNYIIRGHGTNAGGRPITLGAATN